MVTLDHIKQLTADNHSIDAMLAGAKFLGAKFLAEKIGHLRALYRLEGCLPGGSGLSEYSYRLYEQLMTHARGTLPADEFEAFEACY